MLNVLSVGHVPYEAAKLPIPLTVAEKCVVILKLFYDVLRVAILSIPVFLKEIFAIILPFSKKCILGQVAVVTGAGNGLGRAIALRLASQGCHIAVVDVDAKAAHKVAEEARAFGVKANGYKVDVSDFKQVNELKDQVEEDLGPVEILINNAGLVSVVSLHNGPEEVIKRILMVNIASQFWTLRTFLPDMKKRHKGHIVSIASINSFLTFAGNIAYSVTKSATLTLMRGVEQDIRSCGLEDYIKTTCVYPYFISTRKDLFEKTDLRVPPMTPDYAAEKIVDGIRANQRDLFLPGYFSFLMKIWACIPYGVKSLARDFIFREKESTLFDFSSMEPYCKEIDKNQNNLR